MADPDTLTEVPCTVRAGDGDGGPAESTPSPHDEATSASVTPRVALANQRRLAPRREGGRVFDITTRIRRRPDMLLLA